MKSPITLVVPLSKEGSEDFRKSINKKDGMSVVVQRGSNPSANRNAGIRKSKTALIAFINGHSLLSSDWHAKVLKFFKAHPEIDVVGGPEVNSSEDNFFGRISGYALASPFGSGGIAGRYGGKNTVLDASETQLTSANLICRRRVVQKVKFDETLYPGEDPKFISDVKKAGFKVAYYPEIVVSNKRRTNVAALSKQIFRYGKVRPRKESFMETLRRPFFLVPAVFVVYLISLLFYTSLLYLLPLYLYIFLGAIFTLFLSAKNKDVLALLVLPVIFITIHLSYGVGMLYGLAGGR